jgi:hypothetical protein
MVVSVRGFENCVSLLRRQDARRLLACGVRRDANTGTRISFDLAITNGDAKRNPKRRQCFPRMLGRSFGGDLVHETLYIAGGHHRDRDSTDSWKHE